MSADSFWQGAVLTMLILIYLRVDHILDELRKKK